MESINQKHRLNIMEKKRDANVYDAGIISIGINTRIRIQVGINSGARYILEGTRTMGKYWQEVDSTFFSTNSTLGEVSPTRSEYYSHERLLPRYTLNVEPAGLVLTELDRFGFKFNYEVCNKLEWNLLKANVEKIKRSMNYGTEITGSARSTGSTN